LQRVHPVDNHTGDVLAVSDVQAFGRDLQAAWNAGGGAMKELEAQQKKLSEAADLLPLYRQINDPAVLRARADANIRETFRERPGARVLAIVGSTHKPWFDGWLGQLQGVDIVDAQQVLK
jgi:hypothetical protein